MKINTLILILHFNCTFYIHAQEFHNNKININLKDHTVELLNFNFQDQGKIRTYYCMPGNLHLSINENGRPEFLFMSYQKEGSGESEVIMHWLLNMGYSEIQSHLIDSLLKAKLDSSSIFAGQLFAEPIGDIHYVSKGGNPELLQIIKSGLTSGGITPIISNSKSAAAFKFKGTAAERIVECIHDPNKLKGLYIEMDYQISNITSWNKLQKINLPKVITVSLGMEKLFVKAKNCKECIIMYN